MGKSNETKLGRIARAQHACFTRSQARDAGFSASAIRRHLATGRWIRLHRAVFCEAAAPASFERDTVAAVLACGDTAAASHRTAVGWWGVEIVQPARPEVTLLLPAHARPPRVHVHYTERLQRSEAASRSGTRVTSPMRTLADLSSVVEAKQLELVLDAFWRRKLVHPARFLAYLEDPWFRSRAGTGILRSLLRERLGQAPSGSDLETLMFQLIRDAGLPLPVRQHPVKTPFGVRYLDLAYPDHKIAIELDGRASRWDKDIFLDERVRQNLIEAQQWSFRRFGYEHATEHQLWCIFTLGEALGMRPVLWVAR
jgi:hypothetical protein